MKKVILNVILLVVVLFPACTEQSKSNTYNEKHNLKENQNFMNNYVSIFEIPATDFERALKFYQSILSIKIESMDFAGMQMGLFPYEDQMVIGSIMKGEGYKPTSDGVTIYLNGGEDLQAILNKVEPNEGKIVVPKTPHADESGFFAIFLDSEGNKIGLHSPK
ncbi:VOC family protein [Neolewinella persica]|uniref:VOC family protein n=1 Tax=Neolewinella persica TaxID=70998 RepID=UPI000382ACED|nr:VOC family protein [Neolewinella persica]